eukprot:TRINITY_DN27278_c1_g1_i2.p2 TRINITY_DN27278_c1_g1~~TRINITY_DN27278_c1_g1_i2.p2  ORF type:complete len:448 (-),score=46.65 TRINITY_DN27278_c1_g1_i2:166-1419(-)
MTRFLSQSQNFCSIKSCAKIIPFKSVTNSKIYSFIWRKRRCSSLVITTAATPVQSEAEFIQNQEKLFENRVDFFSQELPPEIQQKLSRIVGIVPSLGCDCRILDVGSGAGCLIPHFQKRGWQDILAVELPQTMIDKIQSLYRIQSTLGNDTGVRCWRGDATYLPSYLGPFNCAFFNAVFGNLYDQHKTLLNTSLLLKDGGYIVISHPMGKKWLDEHSRARPDMTPSSVPDIDQLKQLIANLPLQIMDFVDEPGLYCALLQVPQGYIMKDGVLRLEGKVVDGFGRGSKQMGVPTANIEPPQGLNVPLGVYYGWAQLQTAGSNEVHKMVMNIGQRPTIEDGNNITVEAHILHDYNRDFHGEYLKLVAIGFIRPEMKFQGLQELILRIKADVAIAKYQLDDRIQFKQDPFFSLNIQNWKQ